jgi:hypothetical protein
MDATSDGSTPTPGVRRHRTDDESHAQATEFVTELVGSAAGSVVWDTLNRLQGHLHVSGHELVVIAARDEVHRPVVLTVDDWSAVRRDGRSPGALIALCAIVDRTQLVAVLST